MEITGKADMAMGWVDPWAGLGWVGLGRVGSRIFYLEWVGLGWVEFGQI